MSWVTINGDRFTRATTTPCMSGAVAKSIRAKSSVNSYGLCDTRAKLAHTPPLCASGISRETWTCWGSFGCSDMELSLSQPADGSQSTRPSSTAYPTNATMSISA